MCGAVWWLECCLAYGSLRGTHRSQSIILHYSHNTHGVWQYEHPYVSAVSVAGVFCANTRNNNTLHQHKRFRWGHCQKKIQGLIPDFQFDSGLRTVDSARLEAFPLNLPQSVCVESMTQSWEMIRWLSFKLDCARYQHIVIRRVWEVSHMTEISKIKTQSSLDCNGSIKSHIF